MERKPPDYNQQQDYHKQNDVIMGPSPYLNYASTGARIIAYIIDVIIVGLLSIIFFMGFVFMGPFTFSTLLEGGTGIFPFAFLTPLYIITQFGSSLIQLLYFTYLESKEGGGATIGKKILDIEVVDRTGKKVEIKDSFIRNIARLLWSLPCVGLLILLLDIFLIHDSEQRIGDRLANTYVVEEQKHGEITRQYEEGYRQQGMKQTQQRYQQSKTGEMETCPRCGKKALMVSPNGSAYCTKCDYTSMDSSQNR